MVPPACTPGSARRAARILSNCGVLIQSQRWPRSEHDARATHGMATQLTATGSPAMCVGNTGDSAGRWCRAEPRRTTPGLPSLVLNHEDREGSPLGFRDPRPDIRRNVIAFVDHER